LDSSTPPPTNAGGDPSTNPTGTGGGGLGSDAALLDGSVPDPGDPSSTTAGAAVTFQIDPAHSGGQPNSRLRPPLKRKWLVNLSSFSLSYPIIVGGSIFLTGGGGGGAKLYALSAADGTPLWGPIDLGSGGFGAAANAAWDAGKVFTTNGSGLVAA